MDDAGTTHPLMGALPQKLIKDALGEDHRKPVEIDLEVDGQVAALKVGDQPLLDPGPGEEQVLGSLDLGFRKGSPILLFHQVLRLPDGDGRWPPVKRLRLIGREGGRILDGLAKERRVGFVGLSAHGFARDGSHAAWVRAESATKPPPGASASPGAALKPEYTQAEGPFAS